MNNSQNNNPIQNQPNNIGNNPNTTVQPINNVQTDNNVPVSTPSTVQNEPGAISQTINDVQSNVANANNVQQQLKNIATVDQNKEQFINNAQALNNQKKEHKTEEINYVLIIILFVIALIAIIFLFPLLAKYI